MIVFIMLVSIVTVTICGLWVGRRIGNPVVGGIIAISGVFASIMITAWVFDGGFASNNSQQTTSSVPQTSHMKQSPSAISAHVYDADKPLTKAQTIADLKEGLQAAQKTLRQTEAVHKQLDDAILHDDLNGWMYSIDPRATKIYDYTPPIPKEFYLAYVECWGAADYVYNIGSAFFGASSAADLGTAQKEYQRAVAECKKELADPLTYQDVANN